MGHVRPCSDDGGCCGYAYAFSSCCGSDLRRQYSHRRDASLGVYCRIDNVGSENWGTAAMTSGGSVVGYGTGWNDVDDPTNDSSFASNPLQGYHSTVVASTRGPNWLSSSEPHGPAATCHPN